MNKITRSPICSFREEFYISQLNGGVQIFGATENADWKLTNQIAGLENAGTENAGPESAGLKNAGPENAWQNVFYLLALSYVYCTGI